MPLRHASGVPMKPNKIESSAIFAVIYGPSKTGKSTATGAAGASGLFLAQPGGLLPVSRFLGLSGIEYLSPKGIIETAALITSNAGKHPTIVVDDLSILTEVTLATLEKTHTGWDMWRELRSQILFLRDSARLATSKGTHVIFNCHESPPKTTSGKYVRGGPKLPGQLPEQFSAFADVVARVQYDATAAPWKYVLRTGPDAEYICGDRLDIFPDPAPMNLSEAMRCAGYDLPRPKGLEWQESVVEQLSQKLLEEGLLDWRKILRPAAEKLRKNYSLPHIRWAMQDSLNRAVLMNARNNLLDDMFTENSPEGW